MTYSTFLLDLDHTLLDSDTSEIEAYRRALTRQGVESPMVHFAAYKRINGALWAKVERGELLPGDVRQKRFDVLIDELGVDADAAAMADDFVDGFATFGDLYPGARNVLERLAAVASLALVTNGLSEVQRPRIDRLGIKRFFDAIVISAEVGVAKPGGEIFDIAFAKLGSPGKSNVVMVGDSLSSDIRGGADYGIDTCWYNPNGRSSGPGVDVTHQIRSLDELLSLASG